MGPRRKFVLATLAGNDHLGGRGPGTGVQAVQGPYRLVVT